MVKEACVESYEKAIDKIPNLLDYIEDLVNIAIKRILTKRIKKVDFYSFLYYHVNIINAKISIYFKLKTTSTKIKH